MMRRALLRLLGLSPVMTAPGSGGLPPRPVNAPPAGALAGVGVQPGVSQPVVIANRVIITGANGELLVYNPAPGAGNLVDVIAGQAGSDQFGNSFGPGFTSIGGAGAAAQINAAVIGLFAGLNRLAALSPNGLFIYNSSNPAQLLASVTSQAGTDAQSGQAFPQGVGIYINISGTLYLLTFGTQNSLPAMSIKQVTGGPVLPVIYGANAAAATGCSSYLNSGQSTVAAVASVIQAEDSVFSAIANGLIALEAGQVNLGQSAACSWDDNGQGFHLPAGGGPTILGESFHTLSNPANITGTCRIKKMPWNAIWLEGEVTCSTTGGATFTFGAPPNSTYSPTVNLHRPVGSTGVPNAVQAEPRLFIQTGGLGPQLILPTYTAVNAAIGWSIMYPTN